MLALGTNDVSIFALRFAKLHGARVEITSSNNDKLALGRKLGQTSLSIIAPRPQSSHHAGLAGGGQ